jgi:aminopeptidase YwaD
MSVTCLPEKANTYLQKLCLQIPSRAVGSTGNQSATDFFAGVMQSNGFGIERTEFQCMDWHGEDVELKAGQTTFEAQVSPYSLGCDAQGTLVVASDVSELEASDVKGKILLLRGDMAKEPLMPKNFPFYNPNEHKHIINLLESKQPQAIITATGRHAQMAGALYPFPMIEDGDFDIPSVYMTDEEGERLARYTGQEISLRVQAERRLSTGCNVVARKGNASERVVLFAHIDAKNGTPGALDNAAGISTLMLLSELLADYSGKHTIEIVAMNGEDYYSNPGEQDYIRRNTGKFDDIRLGINLDGLGYHHGKTAYSVYECSPDIEAAVQGVFASYPHVISGERWYQGDHFLFVMSGRPALAITSERVAELMTEIVHTPKDRPEIVNPALLVNTAFALRDLVGRLD